VVPSYASATRNKRGPRKKNADFRLSKEKPLPTKGGESVKLLVLPAQEGTKVTRTLESSNLQPRTIGLLNIVEFASGAALLTIQADKAAEFGTRLPELGLRLKPRDRRRMFSFRIHDIPEDLHVPDIAEHIEAATQAKPAKVSTVTYNSQAENSGKFAVVECEHALFNLMRRKRTLLLGYRRCRIDTSPLLMRCRTCSLFGHTKNTCPGIPEEIRPEPSQCLDCQVYNLRMKKAGLPRSRCRDTKHPAGSRDCPTKRCLVKKYVAERRPADDDDRLT